MDAGEAFGETYGTSNLAGQSITVLPHGVGPAVSPAFNAAVLAAQNRRRQAPTGLKPYVAYLNSDPLVDVFRRLAAIDPNVDPAVLTLFGWNHVALDMTSIDHTTAGAKQTINGVSTTVFEFTYGEQFGPPRASRAMAMVHLAMFEAANIIDRKFHSYVAPGDTLDIRSSILSQVSPAPTPDNASMAEAIMVAAHDVLIALYPHKQPLIDVSMLVFSIQIAAQEQTRGASSAASRIALGQQIGKATAAAVVAQRASDHADYRDPTSTCPATPPTTYPAPGLPAPICLERFFPAVTPPVSPLVWTADFIVPNRLQLGANWHLVKPFVINTHEFVKANGIVINGTLTLPPTAMDPDFLQSLNEPAGYGAPIPDPHDPMKPGVSSKYGVKAYGGFGPPTIDILEPPPGQGVRVLTPSKRTDEQTKYAQFWGYDATALLCAPPRLYNMIATSYITDNDHKMNAPHDAVSIARYLALVNLSLADAGIEGWAGKFNFSIARPITYIRSSKNDPAHPEYDNWTPLGQVASNGAAVNVTPPFPAYPSGHAVFGAAVFKQIANVLGYMLNDADSKFDFVSDEYNGETFGLDGKRRPFDPAHYVSLRSAQWENAESRIWLGIHWQRDADDGVALGDEIADAIYARALTPCADPQCQ